MQKPEQNKTALERIEEALKWFWRKHSGAKMMKAKNTEFIVEPKIFIGDKLNPEIARLIIRRYLAKVTPDDIIKRKVIITPEKIIINDDDGKKILEVKSKRLIYSMVNRLTNMIGLELSLRMRKDGEPYLQSEEKNNFSFGDVKDALIQFVADMEKNDSKNLMRDAVLLINNGQKPQKLISPLEKVKTETKDSLA